MKALGKLSAKIDGIQYNVNAGEQLPPALLKFYADNNAIDGLIKTGIIAESVPPITESKTIAGNPIGTRSVKKD